jgi:DNA-binding transcriptional MerR regulator/DNA-binding MarR family transcriptional regulator
VRIGEVAQRTGLSARMIRYHDERGHLPGRSRTLGRHRYFDQGDVEWLSRLQALLAAGIPTATAVRALRHEATAAELSQIASAIQRLGSQLALVRGSLSPARRYELGIERRMTLAFDTFVLRMRMESYLYPAISPAGVIPGDFGLLALVGEVELTPATLARMVGLAPTTVTRRLRNLIDRGWVARRPPGSGRSWVVTVTPAGREVLAAAQPAFSANNQRLEQALREQGVDPGLLREQLQLLSATVRAMLPDEREDEQDDDVSFG